MTEATIPTQADAIDMLRDLPLDPDVRKSMADELARNLGEDALHLAITFADALYERRDVSALEHWSALIQEIQTALAAGVETPEDRRRA